MSTTAQAPVGATRTPTRERILTAAEDVVLRDGVARLTLEAAAAEAGVSKGGVLYHFRTRDALISAMVVRLTDAFGADVATAESADAGPGSFTRAYVRATLRPVQSREEARMERLGAAVLAAVAAEPQLLEPLRAAFRDWQARVESDGLDPALATALRLAADGLWLADVFGFAFVSEELRAAVETELVRLSGRA